MAKKSENIEPITTRSITNPNIVKLPRIELKRFNGDPTCWQTFIDSFESAVDKNEQLTEVEKMNYLINLVQCDAEATVKGLTLSHDNYKIALKLLKDRFDDPQLLISTHMNKLLELETVQHINDAVKGLRRLSDQVETNVRCLEPKSYGPLLITVFMGKLPEELKLIISREFDKVVWDIRIIIDAFKRELQAREKNKFFIGRKPTKGFRFPFFLFQHCTLLFKKENSILNVLSVIKIVNYKIFVL